MCLQSTSHLSNFCEIFSLIDLAFLNSILFAHKHRLGTAIYLFDRISGTFRVGRAAVPRTQSIGIGSPTLKVSNQGPEPEFFEP